MQRKRRFLFCLCIVVILSGCALPDNSWDDAYSAYGGAMERQDRFHGRVGSVLSDPLVQTGEPGGALEPTEADLYPPGLTDEAGTSQ